MKTFSNLSVAVIIILIIAACTGRGSGKATTGNDTITVPDTGYTGIKQYMSGDNIIKEVTFKNGVREGLMKTFYTGGQVYQTFWYENGLREDSGRYYYTEGQLFRTTPYKHDTIDGVQIQYYRTGRVKAKIGYSKGLRTPYLEEFTSDGRLVKGYPEITVTVNDEYKSAGRYRISLALSDKSTKVKFSRGEFTDNRFDTAYVKQLNTVEGRARIDLRKTGTATENHVVVIAAVLTPFGNRNLLYKRIDLPYNDLK
jgi:hypothetical protein